MQDHDVTVTHFVPSMLEEFLNESPQGRAPSLRRVLVSGEELKARVQDRFFALLPDVELHNLYGPTEAAIDVTHWHCLPGLDEDRVPIGRPIDAVRLYVVDPQLRPVPQGERGELCIGGLAVARGYLNRPVEQGASFVRDPFSQEPEAKLYRTGDLASFRPDGVIDYHGRIDNQMKLGGVRIEADEVEAVLEALDGVEQAVVGLRARPGGQQLLVAWLTGALAAEELPGIRKELGRTLPAAFVPSVLIPVDRLPLSRHGKVDRARLPWPAPDEHRNEIPGAGDQDDPADAQTTDGRLRRLWRETLGTDPRQEDGFFAASGDSPLAVHLVASVCREFDVDLTTGEFLRAPRFSSLVQTVTGILAAGRRETSRVLPVPRTGRLTMSSAQRRMWLLHRADPDDAAMNIHGGLRLRGPLDHATVVRVLRDLIIRHEVLRTVFPDIEGDPAPLVREPTGAEVPVPFADCRHLPEERRDEAVAAACAEIGAARFDLADGPLVRARLLAFADDDHFLALGLHHIVADGWSWSVLADEFSRLWADGRDTLPALPVQYQDYAAWEAALPQPEADLAHWREVLRDPPAALRLAGTPARPQELSLSAGVLEVRWPEGFAERLAAFCTRHEVTAFSVLLAGYSLLLGRLARQEDVIVASPLANRTSPDIEPLIGCFINTLPLRLELDEDQTFAELVRQAFATTSDALAHGRLPIESMPLSAAERGPGLSPLLQGLLVVQNTPPWRAGDQEHQVEVLEVPSRRTHYLLKLEVQSLAPPLPTRLVYAADVLDADRAAVLAAQLTGLLDQALDRPDGYVYDFSLISEPR
jgi:hypothetical protein